MVVRSVAVAKDKTRFRMTLFVHALSNIPGCPVTSAESAIVDEWYVDDNNKGRKVD